MYCKCGCGRSDVCACGYCKSHWLRTEENRKKDSEAHMGQIAWNKNLKMSDEFRKTCRQAQLGKSILEKTKKKLSIKAKAYWADFKNREAQSQRKKGQKISDEQKIKLSKAGLEAWSDPKKAARILHGMHVASAIHPNSIEEIVDNLTPKNVKFVGDKSFFVLFKNGRHKNPDFIVKPFDRTKKVIEVNGNFWHRHEPINYLKNQYNKIGINCLTIWQSELKDLNKVRQKLNRFLAA